MFLLKNINPVRFLHLIPLKILCRCTSDFTHKRPVKGTGLGLSIVKTVLDRHGFHCGVESEEGAGSLFYVDFPLLD